MPYETWHIYGYGVCTSEIKEEELTVERFENLLSLAPEFRKKILQYFEECEINEPEVNDYLEFDQDYHHEIAYLLKEVIEECVGIELCTCDSCDGSIYLLYPPLYPWQMNEIDYKVTKPFLNEIFNKYIGMICDTIPDIDVQSCENGG